MASPYLSINRYHTDCSRYQHRKRLIHRYVIARYELWLLQIPNKIKGENLADKIYYSDAEIQQTS